MTIKRFTAADLEKKLGTASINPVFSALHEYEKKGHGEESQNQHGSLATDLSRQVYVRGKLFHHSPFYEKKEIASSDKQQQALEQFLQAALFHPDNKPLYDHWHQSVMSLAIIAMDASAGVIQDKRFDKQYLCNITVDANGCLCVDTLLFNLTLGDINEEKGTPLKIPGTVTTRFVLTDQGFRFDWLETSNTLLEKICLQKEVFVDDHAIEQAIAEEKNSFRAHQMNQCADWILSESDPHQTITALTTQLIHNPLHETALVLYKQLKNQQRKKLRRHMQQVIDQCHTAQFSQAYQALGETLMELPEYNPLKKYGKKVLKETLKQSNQLRHLPTLTRILFATRRTLRDPSLDHIKHYQRLATQTGRRSWGKVLSGAMLALAGTALIIASGIIAVASFGIIAPLSVYGITAGIATVAAALTLTTGALSLERSMSFFRKKPTLAMTSLAQKLPAFASYLRSRQKAEEPQASTREGQSTSSVFQPQR